MTEDAASGSVPGGDVEHPQGRTLPRRVIESFVPPKLIPGTGGTRRRGLLGLFFVVSGGRAVEQLREFSGAAPILVYLCVDFCICLSG